MAMEGQGGIQLRFRLADDTDIGPGRFSPTTNVATLKEYVVAEWPKERENGPKTIKGVRLIYGGKILDKNRMLIHRFLFRGGCVGEPHEGVVTIHVIQRTEASRPDELYERMQGCLCLIL